MYCNWPYISTGEAAKHAFSQRCTIALVSEGEKSDLRESSYPNVSKPTCRMQLQSRFRQTEILSTRKIQTYRSMIFVRLSSFSRREQQQRHTYPLGLTVVWSTCRSVSSSATSHIYIGRQIRATRALCRYLLGQTKVIFVRHRPQKLSKLQWLDWMQLL